MDEPLTFDYAKKRISEKLDKAIADGEIHGTYEIYELDENGQRKETFFSRIFSWKFVFNCLYLSLVIYLVKLIIGECR